MATYLHFAHAFDLEDPYDGGVVEYSENGTTWVAMNTLVVVNGPLSYWILFLTTR